MIFADCFALRRHLGAFVDGELSGAERLSVSHHLEVCRACAAEVATVGEIGDLLRRHANAVVPQPDLAGLPGGIFTRTRAESAESWGSLVGRALSDWRWTIVGAGSAAATAASTVFVSLILALGPQPKCADSLSALMSNLGDPSVVSVRVGSAGVLFIYSTSPGTSRDAYQLQAQGNGSETSRGGSDVGAGIEDTRSEAELVGALADVVTRKGRVVALEAMHPADRRNAEDLINKIGSRRMEEPVPIRDAIGVSGFRLVTSVNVPGL